jgi:hypothetical protein
VDLLLFLRVKLFGRNSAGRSAKLALIPACALALHLSTINAPAAIGAFVNGSFESDFTGWTVSGNLEIFTGGASNGIKAVEFNGGNTTPNGTLSQTFATVAGQSYALSFDAGVQAFQSLSQMKMQVTVQGTTTLLSQSVTVSGQGTGTWYTPKSFNFVADGASATLTFQDTSSATTNIDLLLDNVVITGGAPTPSPTPTASPGPSATPTPGPTNASVTIQGEKFLINGFTTLPGSKLEGTLPNSRMVQATFDDANGATAGKWKYPNGNFYSAARQTNEFVAALPSYRAKGLLAVSLNFQGGTPINGSLNQPWDNTAFNADGSLKPAYLSRMDQAIRALNAQGMVAILGYFYCGQDERLSNETAVKNAVTNATQWVLTQGYTNVLIEIANEVDANGPTPSTTFQHAILSPARVGELISAVQSQSVTFGRRLNVSVSLIGGHVPSSSLAQACDFILLHANNQTSSTVTAMVNTARGYGLNKPIVCNEDSTSIANFQAATNAHVSWGYFDAGQNNYVDGFQSPPTNWSINTTAKQSFFNLLVSYAAPNPAPIVSINRGANGTTVAFSAVGGVTYRLERKLSVIDLSWQSISGVNDFSAASTGTAQIIDPSGASLGMAFYRVYIP